jgi:hypothetical protein
MALLRATVLLLLMTGCAGRTQFISPAQNFNAAMVQTILAAEQTREDVLFAAGRSYAQGILNDEGRVWILQAGDAAQRAIDGAKRSLTRFIGQGGSRAPVYAAFAVLDQIMLDLILRREEALEGVGEVLP